MNVPEIEHRTDYWLLAFKQMKEHGVITTQQKKTIDRKIKAWCFDNLDEQEVIQGGTRGK